MLKIDDDGNSYQYPSLDEIIVNGEFVLVRLNSMMGIDIVDLKMAAKINNWEKIINKIVNNHINSLGESINVYTQEVKTRLVNFLNNALVHCNYQCYYDSICLLKQIQSSNTIEELVFCYNNDHAYALKPKRNW